MVYWFRYFKTLAFILFVLTLSTRAVFAAEPSPWTVCPLDSPPVCIDRFINEPDLVQRGMLLHNYAVALREAGNDAEAAHVLSVALNEALRIEDGYDAVNVLRYVAEQYYRLGQIAVADAVFVDAAERVASIQPYFRKLSAMIGVVEIARKVDYSDGTRRYAMTFIESGILEEVASHGKTGETNRFLTNLDTVLYPSDVEVILSHLQNIEWLKYRKRVLYKLTTLTYRLSEGYRASESLNALLQGWKSVDEKERDYIVLLLEKFTLSSVY